MEVPLPPGSPDDDEGDLPAGSSEQQAHADAAEAGDDGMSRSASVGEDQHETVVDDTKVCSVCQEPCWTQWVSPSNWHWWGIRCGATAQHLTAKGLTLTVKGVFCGECRAKNWREAKQAADVLSESSWYTEATNDFWCSLKEQSVRTAFATLVPNSAEYSIEKVWAGCS